EHVYLQTSFVQACYTFSGGRLNRVAHREHTQGLLPVGKVYGRFGVFLQLSGGIFQLAYNADTFLVQQLLVTGKEFLSSKGRFHSHSRDTVKVIRLQGGYTLLFVIGIDGLRNRVL